jgi:hypothetical protein
VQAFVNDHRWNLLHVAGLTYPISNLLLPVSSLLERKSESSKLAMSPLERTKESGRRQVKFKTHFPSVLGMLLNRVAMGPAHSLQKMFSKPEKALVIYFEAKPAMEALHG